MNTNALKDNLSIWNMVKSTFASNEKMEKSFIYLFNEFVYYNGQIGLHIYDKADLPCQINWQSMQLSDVLRIFDGCDVQKRYFVVNRDGESILKVITFDSCLNPNSDYQITDEVGCQFVQFLKDEKEQLMPEFPEFEHSFKTILT